MKLLLNKSALKLTSTVTLCALLLVGCRKKQDTIITPEIKGFEITLPENFTGEIGQIHSNLGEDMKYYFQYRNPLSSIQLDRATGILSTKSVDQLDFETSPIYELRILSETYKDLEPAIVKINLIDKIDYIRLKPDTMKIFENPLKDQIIGTIDGYSDLGPIDYSFSQSLKYPEAVYIDNKTKTLRVKDPKYFDFELIRSMTVYLEGNDGVRTAHGTTIIEILDSSKESGIQNQVTAGANPVDLYNTGKYQIEDFYGVFYQGGHIFYFEPSTKRYMVAYINDKTSYSYPWSKQHTLVTHATDSAIGKGEENTNKISLLSNNNYAATYCKNRTLNNKSDWFLPSLHELKLLYTSLYSKGYSSLVPEPYWTSTEHNESNAFTVDFGNGGKTLTRHKIQTYKYIPVRSFKE